MVGGSFSNDDNFHHFQPNRVALYLNNIIGYSHMHLDPKFLLVKGFVKVEPSPLTLAVPDMRVDYCLNMLKASKCSVWYI